MTYWEKLVNEILNRYEPKATFYFIPQKQDKKKTMTTTTAATSKPKRKHYPLGPKYPHIAFSRQESICMKFALAGKNVHEIAEKLKLSPRTVEFYFIKMRYKLDCSNKQELIQKVKHSHFLENAEEIDLEFPYGPDWDPNRSDNSSE